MTWFDCIRELCLQVCHEDTVRDILETAVEENMLSAADANRIALDVNMGDVLNFQE
jgi:hypothetical protein